MSKACPRCGSVQPPVVREASVGCAKCGAWVSRDYYEWLKSPAEVAAPDLLAALRELVARCDGEEGVRADGSNIQTMMAHAAIAKAEEEE